jgi:hypothetical protein
MMTQQLGFSILTAPLAAIDRRALSQAWYSALHLARDGQPQPTASRQTVLRGASGGTQRVFAPSKEPRSQAPASPLQRVNKQDERCRNSHAATERRARRSPLARKIERTFLDPRSSAARATFTVDGTRARVHVALQSAQGRIRLVAVCPPSVRATVAQALLQARYALAVRGIDLAIETTGEPVCM